MEILWSILIGALCGYIASLLMKSKRGGLLFYIIAGILGGALGHWVAGILKIGGGGLIWQILIGVAGTCLLIWLCRLIFKK